MARFYIKDLIKSILKLDANSTEFRTQSTASLCSRTSTDDETDQDGGVSQHAMGLPSSNGGPFRGRSIKEIDELTTNLRKENFNLKLRIYFLEERMGTNFNLDKENAIKKNIELKVEVESLKKELVEKQELLCQAVKAMELDEEEHKKESMDKDRKINQLQTQVESLQQKYELFQDDMRSNGDALNEPPGLKKVDSNLELLLSNLENKVKDLEMELEKEKENGRELENMLQLSENRSDNLLALEAELKHKEELHKKLNADLEERNKIITTFHARINSLEDDVAQRQRDVDFLKKDVEKKNDQIQELQGETEEFHKIASETRALYESEKRKGERHKTSILHRNAKIVELENQLEKNRAKLMNLEARLEAAQNEVTMHGKAADAELSAKKISPLSQLRRSHSTSSPEKLTTSSAENSCSALTVSPLSESAQKNMDQLQNDINKSKRQVTKLEQDQLKACRIIQSMLDKQKKNEQKIKELRDVVIRKDIQIEELSGRLNKVTQDSDDGAGECVVVQAVVEKSADQTNACLTSTTVNSQVDNENSAAEGNEDPKLLLEQYKELTDSLEEQKQVLMCTLEETKYQMQELEVKHKELQQQLKFNENRVVDLEFELLSLSQGVNNDKTMNEKSDTGNEKPSNFFISEIEDKDREIERLENELRKRTCDLQGIVNKELWEKNREIEKLQKRYGEIIAGKDGEISKLEQNLNTKNDQLKLLKEKISELGLNINTLGSSVDTVSIKELEEKLRTAAKERDYFKSQIAEIEKKYKHSAEIELLQREHKELQQELERSQRLRDETNDVCSLLSTRLEELACFLDSLLKQKSILGYLGHKQNDKIRQLINQSLDISRTLTMSFTLDPDQSLLQLSNITLLLNTTRNDSINVDISLIKEEEKNTVLSVVPANVSLSYQSHLYPVLEEINPDDQSHIITALRCQVENLKKEIEIRDTELGKLTVTRMTPEILKHLANKERFETLPNEPQKNEEVFLDAVELDADNGLRPSPSSEKSMNTSTTLKFRQENSESESWSEPDRSVSKARIGLDECVKPRHTKDCETSTVSTEEDAKSLSKSSSRKNILAENRQTIINLHEQICELENLVKTKDDELQAVRELLEQTQEDYNTAREKNKTYETFKIELMMKIDDTEAKLAQAEAAKQEADEQLEELRNTVVEVKTSQKLLQDTLEIKNKETQNKIYLLEMEKSNALDVIQLTEQAAKEELERVTQDWEEKMTSRESEFEAMMKSLELKADTEIKKLTESARELQSKYEAECVKRNEVNNLMATIKELEKVRKVVKVADDRIHVLEEIEENLKRQLQENEVEYKNRVNVLHQELEKINLLYSESLLEKSRILNEKTELDRELKEFSNKEDEFIRQVREYKDDFTNMKENFQKQVAHLEHQKSKLEVRISLLEQQNAELKNKLVRLQSGDQISLPKSAPNSTSRILDLFLNKTCPPAYKRQYSENSGYTSEDAYVEASGIQKTFNAVMDLVPMDVERQHSNSSPDLGIESDHGRFSSLETSVNLSRPFLKTLELTESMTNLLNRDELQLQACSNEQCCVKTKEIVKENNDLRKRLLRTRRALEETVSQLTVANQRKKQVEKTICKQIHKTSQVLRKAKANLDSGSENDINIRN